MMLRYLKFWLVFAAMFGLPIAAHAAATEAVTNITQSATLSRPGSIAISEDISYDFAGTTPHDITYTIPLSYHDDQGRDYRMTFSLTQAKLDGQPISLTPKVTTDIAHITLPAGASTATTRHYTVVYSLAPTVLRGLAADTFKLSVTGLGWAVPIHTANLHLETPVAPADNLTCYTGSQGSTTGACTVDQQGSVANVISYATLQPGESLSIFADFPHGSFTSYLQTYEAHPSSPLRKILEGVGIVALSMVILIVAMRFWYRRRARQSIVVESSPDYTNANETAQDKAQHK
jgi:hypothetical protein